MDAGVGSFGWICVFFFAGVLLFSFLINRILLKFARTLGIRNHDQSTVIRWSSQSKPAMGGITFYLVFLLSIIFYAILFDPDQFFISRQFLGVLIAINLGFMMGLADDAYNTNPVLKFSVQLLCGLTLIFSGTCINISDITVVNYFLTLFWVVGIMNSINMLDNMDAITGVVSFFIILSAMVMLFLTGEFQNIYFFLMCGILAALLGFLYFNWHPSQMYMGDTGSQFLGIFLAATSIMFLWNNPVHFPPLSFPDQFIIPLLVFIIPIIDTTTVVINRLLRGQSPFVGGKDHTTHTLVYLGLTDRQVAILYGFISSLSLALAIIVRQVLFKEWTLLYSLIFFCYILLLFAVFFYTTKIKKERVIS